MTKISAIGLLLRQHRKKRHCTQLDLALSAGTTPRYISFIETGRSRPGKNVILRLAEALTLTLRETNALLVAAGLPMSYAERSLDEQQMEPVKRTIDHILKKHEPFPAWVIAPGLRFMASNNAAEKIFPGLVGMEPIDLIDLWCSPSDRFDEQQRAHIIFQTLNGLRHEALYYPHPDVNRAIERVEYYAKDFSEPPIINDTSVMCPTLFVNGQQVRTLTTVMRFDKVVEVTMEEIRIELVFPADQHSESIFRAL